MSLAINKILVAGANANSEGAYFQAETITVPQNSAYVLAAGAYYVYPTANVVIQVNDNTNGAAFANVYAANACGLVIADGVNVRLKEFGNAANVNVSVVTVNGGEAAPLTYA